MVAIIDARTAAAKAAQYKDNEHFYRQYRRGQKASLSWRACWEQARNLSSEENRLFLGPEWVAEASAQLKKLEDRAQMESDAVAVPETHG